MKLPISLVVITKNEEENLARCLQSVDFASEIIVVDSGSTDKTCEIAQKLGAKCIQKDWMGFGKQKKFATELAKNDWVLNLDADEALSSQLRQEIIDRFAQLDPRTGYLLPRKSFHMGRWILHGGWYPDYQLRFFNKKNCQWNEVPIHEKVLADKTEKFKNPILHYLFKDLADQVDTNNRYSTLQAQEHLQKGKKFSFFKMLHKSRWKFFECYILKRGFLDGIPGLVIAVGAAYSVFIRWAKIWELEQQAKRAKKNA